MTNELELLGEPSVYPGHPVVLALCIVRKFPTWDAAFERVDGQPSAALRDVAIPGSGGAVYLALSLLMKLRDGYTWDQAMIWSELAWGSIDNQVTKNTERFRQGMEQARRYAPMLREMEAWWQE